MNEMLSADRRARRIAKSQSTNKEMNSMSCYALQLTPLAWVAAPAKARSSSQIQTLVPNLLRMTSGLLPCNPSASGSTTLPKGPFGAVLQDFQSVVNATLPPPDWVIEPLIVQGERSVIYGEYGSLKSWILLDMAMHMAAGRDWLGHFKISKPRKVLYIDEEMSKSTLVRRVQRLALGAALNAQALELKFFWHIGLRFDSSNAATNLLAELNAHAFDPDVIIIETFRRVLVGSENEARDVNAFWNHIEPLFKAGKAIVIAHHMKKPHPQVNQAARDRFSGHTGIISGSDASFSITRLPSQPGHVRLKGEKSRETAEVGEFEVRLDADPNNLAGPAKIELVGPPAPTSSGSTLVAPQATALQVASKTAQAKDFIEDELAKTSNRTLRPNEIKKSAATAGHTERTVERALKEMLGEKVRKTDTGDYQLI